MRKIDTRRVVCNGVEDEDRALEGRVNTQTPRSCANKKVETLGAACTSDFIPSKSRLMSGLRYLYVFVLYPSGQTSVSEVEV